MTLEIHGLRKRFGDVQALDGVRFDGHAGRGLRVPRCERRRQDDHDADRARVPSRRRRHGHLEGPRRPALAASHVGLPAGGTRALSADARPRAARVLRVALRRVARDVARAAGARLARALPDRRVRGPQGREPLEGQPAEGPVHRDDPPRPGRPPHGRAVQRPRSGQRRAAEGARSSSCATAARRSSSAPISWTWPKSSASRSRSSITGGSSTPGPPAMSSARPVTRSSGSPRLADGDVDWLMSLPHVTVTRPGEDYTELRVDAGRRPAGRPAGGDPAMAATSCASRSPTRRSRRSSSSASGRHRQGGADAGGGRRCGTVDERPLERLRRGLARVRTRTSIPGRSCSGRPSCSSASWRSRSPRDPPMHRPDGHAAIAVSTDRGDDLRIDPASSISVLLNARPTRMPTTRTSTPISP